MASTVYVLLLEVPLLLTNKVICCESHIGLKMSMKLNLILVICIFWDFTVMEMGFEAKISENVRLAISNFFLLLTWPSVVPLERKFIYVPYFFIV